MNDTASSGAVVLDAENPWPGLHEFDERGRDFFNGRDLEAAALLRLVRNEPLTVLFGRSGLGKTSLLRAGLFPHLRLEHYLPVYVRFEPRNRDAPLVEQAAHALRQELALHQVECPPFLPRESLWDYLHRTGLELWSSRNQLLTPVFVFDQFEEVFTLGAENAQAVQRLREDLADLIENRIPGSLARRLEAEEPSATGLDLEARRYRAVLSFREDYLPDVDGWRRAIPSLARNRLRLLPMDAEQAFQAVSKTGGKLVDAAMARAIVAFVAAARGATSAGSSSTEVTSPAAATASAPPSLRSMESVAIEPPLLSLVCTGLNDRRKTARKAAIDLDLLKGTGYAIVTEFYEGCVRDLPLQTRRFIEDELVTEGGFRNPYPRADALERGVITPTVLEELVRKRLVRVEPHMGTERIELVHDLLTGAVRAFRDEERRRKRREREAQAERRRRRQLIFAGIVVLAALATAGAFGRMWLKEKATFDAYRREQEMRRSAESEIKRRDQLATADKDHRTALARVMSKDLDGAVQHLNVALAAYHEAKDPRRETTTLLDLGKVMALKREYDRARELLDRARKLATGPNGDASEREALEGQVLESLASLEELQGNRDQALDLYARAHDKYAGAGDLTAVSRVLERLAAHAEETHEYDEAKEQYGRARDGYAAVGDRLGLARTAKAIDRVVPWGFLVNLKTGKTFQMRGDRITVGRDSPDAGVKNDLSFSNNLVSRRHLAIARKKLVADDLRSRNGTSHNGALVPYGEGFSLNDGDVITLANLEPLQFRTSVPPPLAVPKDAWGIFVDGSRRPRYLVAPEYSVLLAGGRLTLERGAAPSAFMRLRSKPGGAELLKEASAWDVLYVLKPGDYEYETYILWSGKWMDAIDVPATCARLSPDGKKVVERGPSFQVVLMESRP